MPYGEDVLLREGVHVERVPLGEQVVARYADRLRDVDDGFHLELLDPRGRGLVAVAAADDRLLGQVSADVQYHTTARTHFASCSISVLIVLKTATIKERKVRESVH